MLRPYKELGGEEVAEDVVDGLGVGLAAGGLHDLADEKFEDAFVTGFEFGNVFGIFGDSFASGLLDGGVADLGAQAFGGDDFGGGAAGLEHGSENFFGDGSGDFGGFDKVHQLGESGWRDGAGGNFFAGIFQAAKKLGLHPVGSGFAWGAGFDDGFEIVGERLRASKNFGVVGRDSVSGDEAGALGFGEFRKSAADFFAPGRADVDGEKVGVREIAVVVGFFFRAHGDSVAFDLIPEARLLRDA